MSPAFANGTTTVQHWAPPQVQLFDPAKPAGAPADPNKPGDLPGPPLGNNGRPLIPASEDAAAVATLDPMFTVDTSAPDAAGQVTITHIDLTVAGSTVLYLPGGATQQLQDHENGHDALYNDEYVKHAQQKLTESVKALVGTKYGSAADAKAAVDWALDTRGTTSLLRQMEISGDKFDTLTNHGRNNKIDPKTGKPVDTPTGITMTRAELANAPAAGHAPARPAPVGPVAATAPDPARVFFDAATSKLSFGGDLVITCWRLRKSA